MKTHIKLSGLTRLEDARYASAVGADFLAFDQDPASPRYVEPRTAKEIIEWVVGPEPVGVFVDEPAEAVNARCAEAGFRLAQLDGHEPPEVCAAVAVPVIKTLRVRHDASAEQLRALLAPYRDAVDFVRLDAHGTSLLGGTGESVNWRIVRELAAEFDLFLAGAITAENVAEAVEAMRPYAVDVGASVEEAPGVMDFDQLGAFIDAFRATTT